MSGVRPLSSFANGLLLFWSTLTLRGRNSTLSGAMLREAGSPRSRSRAIQYLVRTCFLVFRWVSSHCSFMLETERERERERGSEGKLAPVFYKDTNLICDSIFISLLPLRCLAPSSSYHQLELGLQHMSLEGIETQS